MNKSLLLSVITTAAVGAALPAHAEFKEPIHFDGLCANHISPNGKYIVSDIYGQLNIMDTETGTVTLVTLPGASEDDYIEFSIGHGSCISNDGIVLAAYSDGVPQYWKDGEFYNLSHPGDGSYLNSTNAITPDGKRICGSIGNAAYGMDDALMLVPAIWTRDANGEYGKYEELPHPAVDFTGRTPQYITALDISDDGQTVIGQIVDCVGYVVEPIVYTCGADGKWEYTLPCRSLINPDNIEFPEDPGDSPQPVSPQNWYTEEQAAKYNEAFNAWVASGYDGSLYPDPLDYLTDEQKAEYEAALADYDKAYAEWDEKFTAYTDVYYGVIENAPTFVFNNVALTPDGKYYGTTSTKYYLDIETYTEFSISTPYRIETATGNYVTFKGDDNTVGTTCILADGTIMGSTPISGAAIAYISNDKNELIPLSEWLNANYPEYGKWMSENMVWSYEWFNMETYESETIEDALLSGVPMATPDGKVIATWVPNIWDYTTQAETFVFDLRDPSSINGVAADTAAPEADDTIYDLTGRKVAGTPAPGIYIQGGKKIIIR